MRPREGAAGEHIDLLLVVEDVDVHLARLVNNIYLRPARRVVELAVGNVSVPDMARGDHSLLLDQRVVQLVGEGL